MVAAHSILRLADAEQHIDTVALWNHDEWGGVPGRTLETSKGWFRDLIRNPGEECIIAVSGEDVLGMASLTDHDLEERPDLVHWLASVYVPPALRGHGLGSALVTAVEEQARARGIARIHLYTESAESLYRRLGWQVSERFRRGDQEFALMTKDLAP